MSDNPQLFTDEHRQLLGKEFHRAEWRLTRELILEYAEIMGVQHPIYLDAEAARARGHRDLIALPSLLLADSAWPLVPPSIPFSGIGLNAGYECEFYSDICPGDTLTYSTCLADLYTKTGRSGMMNFVIRETTITNQLGERVALIRNPFILRW